MADAIHANSAGSTTLRPAGNEAAFVAAFALVTSLFFMWAIANNLNDILIKQFEKALQLTRMQASFIQIAFYVGYFIFALPAGFAMKRFGFKRTMMLGLALYGIGALAFYPAADVGTFSAFLMALFIIASGVVCLEISAGAFIVLSGVPERSAFRINLAQAFNGLGAVVAPILGGMFILGHERSAAEIGQMQLAELAQFRSIELHQVQVPYLVIGVVAFAISLLIGATRFPVEARSRALHPVDLGALFRKRVFVAATLAQFFYVGAQTAAWSFFIDFVKDTRPELSERSAAYLLSVSLFLFMVGRFSGSILLRSVRAPAALVIFGLLACCATFGAVVASAYASVACLICLSFFLSIMYPTIFAIGIEAAGEQAEMGAAVLVMTIVGGAMVPPVLGYCADHYGTRQAYLVLIACFLVIVGFGQVALMASARTQKVSL